MDTLPLPPSPNLEQYRKRAKELVKAAASPDDDAVRAWATDWVEDLNRRREGAPTPFVEESFSRAAELLVHRVQEAQARDGRGFSLAAAQFLIARAHGFPRWEDFAAHVESLARDDGRAAPFERAADAVVGGDLGALKALLVEETDLARARSTREHRATLLHYVAANGVEDFRQLTPPNAVAVARALLDAGADVDALANTYGGGNAQTTMNLLVSSVHPARAGLQSALVETLLDAGAAIDGLDDDGSPLMTALAFGYAEAAETLARRGARVDNVLAAAALDDADRLRELVAVGGTVPQSLADLYWLALPSDRDGQLGRALVWAGAHGRRTTTEMLLEHGVDVAAVDKDGMTALHWASANRHVDVVELLLARGAPLEAKNRWGGTVLSSTVYMAFQDGGEVARYAPVVAALIDAGADLGAVSHPTGNAELDGLLVR